MKKSFCLLSALCAAFFLASCELPSLDFLPFLGDSTQSSEVTSVENGSTENPEVGSSVGESSLESSEPDSSVESSEESTTPENPTQYQYTDFTSEEKSLFNLYVGEVLPFPATDEYYFEGYYEETDYENGINFYTAGNTQADFDAYRALFTDYTLYETSTDDYGDTWYCYTKADIVVDMSYYYYENEYWIDVYVYSSLSEDGGSDGSGDDWGDDWGDDGGDGSDSEIELITNEGKGLPTSANGVYNVDFTKATYVKDVTDQGYYLDGCPTTGSPAVLVIPVEFTDSLAAKKGYSIDKIKTAFNGLAGSTDYYSVYDYFYTSSNGALKLDITVLDSWFKPQYSSSYYKSQTIDYYGTEVAIGDQMIIHEALTYLEGRMDLSQFDSDNNGFIDSVVIINTLAINNAVDMQWAYRWWNIYEDSQGNYYEYDGVSANDYLWASYLFMHEDVDRNGNPIYTNSDALNTYTYIHEFSHVLGADDYYDTAYVNPPMNGYDMMDAMTGDHSPYTKFNYGWLTTSRLVVAEDSLTLTLEDFSKSGDTIIVANNWDESLGAYQEYYVLVYYRNVGLNGGKFGYFDNEGILVYHVNASLYKETIDGETYYDVYNNNTDASDQDYGTEDNLIEFVLSSAGNYVYRAGDNISANTKDDQGNKIAYTFTVDALTSTTATITFRRNK